MQATEITVPTLLLRAAETLRTETGARFPTAFEFVLFLAKREERLARLDRGLAEAEAYAMHRLDRRRFLAFWTGEYKLAFDPAFQTEIDNGLGPGWPFWPKPREAVDERIRTMASATDPETREVGTWLWEAFAACYDDTPETRKTFREALGKANHLAIEAAGLGRDYPAAHAANLVERDPLRRGTRLWIRRQRRETAALLRELRLIEEDGALACVRLSPPNRRVTYAELVRCAGNALAPSYLTDPAAETAWQDRTAPFRAVMTDLTP